MLAFDHVFCFVPDPAAAVRRLEADGWTLDAGQRHAGQGTRNRRLRLAGHFVEVLWLEDADEARGNPLRLDRRADPGATGASPVGLGFRGELAAGARGDFWLYDALGPRIWVRRGPDEAPLVFVIELPEAELALRRPAGGESLREIRVRAPAPPALPPDAGGPAIVHEPGEHRLELIVGRHPAPRPITERLLLG